MYRVCSMKQKLLRLANYLNTLSLDKEASQIRKLTENDLKALAPQLPWVTRELEYGEPIEPDPEEDEEDMEWMEDATILPDTRFNPEFYQLIDTNKEENPNKWIEHRLEQPFGDHIIKEINRPDRETIFLYKFFPVMNTDSAEEFRSYKHWDPFSHTPPNGYDYEARIIARRDHFEEASTLEEAKYRALNRALEFLKDKQRYVEAMSWLKDMPSEKSRKRHQEMQEELGRYLTGTSEQFKVAWDIFIELEHAKEAERLEAELRERKRKADEEYEIDMEITRMKEDRYFD